MSAKLPILPRGWSRGLPVAAARPADVPTGERDLSLADFMPDRPADRDPGLGRRLMPATVESILVTALQGDLRQQERLFQIMCDTWPVLGDCMRTRRDAATAADWCVHPQEGADDTVKADAQLRADVVERCLWGMTPNPRKLELGAEGLLEGLAMDTVTGHGLYELRWEMREEERLGGGRWAMLRSVRRLGARWYRWSATGEDELLFTPQGGAAEEWPEHKTILQISRAHSGHPSEAAPLRVLCKYWLAGTFGFEWLLKYAQLFGAPFRVAYYDKGSKNVLGKIMAMLEGLGAAGYGAFPAGTKIEWLEAARAAGELPQKLVSEIADTACRIVLTGQTLATSQSTEGGGTYAQSKVHGDMRAGVLRAMLAQISGTLTGQLVPSVMALNFGDARLSPEIRVPEEAAEESPKEKAERDDLLLKAGVPLPRTWFYDRHGVPIPAEGEEVIGGTGDGGAEDSRGGAEAQSGKGGAEEEEESGTEEDPDYEAEAGKEVAAARGLPVVGEITRLALERGLAAGRRAARREMRAAEAAEEQPTE